MFEHDVKQNSCLSSDSKDKSPTDGTIDWTNTGMFQGIKIIHVSFLTWLNQLQPNSQFLLCLLSAGLKMPLSSNSCRSFLHHFKATLLCWKSPLWDVVWVLTKLSCTASVCRAQTTGGFAELMKNLIWRLCLKQNSLVKINLLFSQCLLLLSLKCIKSGVLGRVSPTLGSHGAPNLDNMNCWCAKEQQSLLKPSCNIYWTSTAGLQLWPCEHTRVLCSSCKTKYKWMNKSEV